MLPPADMFPVACKFPFTCVLPTILTLPVPVIDLLNKSRLPPSWGVVSSTRLDIPPAPPPADTVL